MLDARGLAAALALAAGAAAIAGCGGSTAVETVVGPDGVRCQTTLTGPTSAVPPNGGTVSVGVSAARDCTWTAASEASWMQLNATSGQGNATLTVTVARNEVTSSRSGAVAVNNQRVTISQEARPCTYELRASTQRVSAEGGRGTIAVETLDGCSWSAASSAEWLRVLTPSGSGPASVAFEAAANAGRAREASITIAGRSVTISQAAASQGGGGGPTCTFTLTPSTLAAPAAGGTQTLALATASSCDWTATSSAAWVTVAPAAGRGNATLTLTVARNTGNARSATVTAGDDTATVNQAAAPVCTVSIDPTSASYAAGGGDGRVRVTTQDGCDWSVSGGASWTQVTTGRGTGSGDARYTVAANTAPSSRSTTLTIGGRSHTVSQHAAAPTCTYSIEPSSRSFPAAGGDGTVSVNTQAGCQWSASGAPSWISINGGQGTGSGQFSYTVQSNGGGSRSGTIAVAGQSHTVSQEAAAPTCTYTLQPGSLSFGANGGEGRFDVVTQPNCNWSPVSGASWVSISSGSGSGPATVIYSVQPNSGSASRSTTITVAGQTHSITQEAAAPTCTYSLQPTSQSFGASGGSGQFTVTTQAGCSWSASSGAAWVTTSSSGSGPGTVSFSVQSNSATSSRQATISVGGQSFSVMQEAAAPTCTYTLQPTSQNFAAAGGSGQFTVTTQAGCAWTASSGAGWVTTSSSGSGSGSVGFSVQANTGAARQTAITVAGQSFTVTQDAGSSNQACTYSISPGSRTFDAEGGQGTVQVATTAGCAWSASSPVSWISLASSGGSGPGQLSYSVAAYGGDDRREADISVAGHSHRVRQNGDDN